MALVPRPRRPHSPGNRWRVGGPQPAVFALSNGARVIVCPTTASTCPVSIELWVMAGTCAERPDEGGCAHLLEHMVFKPVDVGGVEMDLAAAIEAMGGDVNAFTSHDETVFHATVPRASALDALRTLGGAVLRPRFDPAEVDKEIQVVLEEIKQYDDDLASRVHQDLMTQLYGEHGYGRPVLGPRAVVARHDPGVLRRFHRRLYTGERIVLVVAGPVDPKRVRNVAAGVLGVVSAGRTSPARPPKSAPSGGVRIRSVDAQEAHLALGWLAPAAEDPDAAALDVACVVLGYGDASRLTTRTRRERRLVTDAHAQFYPSRLGSSVVVSATTSAALADDAIAGLLEETEELGSVPLAAEDLARAKRVLMSDVVYRRETVQGMTQAVGYQLSLRGDLDAEERYFDTLDRLGPDDVCRACRTYLGTGSVQITGLVPGTSARRMAGSVRRRLGASGAGTRRVRRRSSAGIEGIDVDGGVSVRAVVDPSVPIVAGWLVWPGGAHVEAGRDLGAASLMASLLTRGMGRTSGDALAAEVEGLAAVLEGFSGRSSLGLHFEGLSAHAPVLLRRAFECALDPWFDDDELDEERRVALEDLKAEEDDPGELVLSRALGVLYRGHPFARRHQGTRATLERLRSGRLHRLWRQGYPLHHATLGLCGDLDLDQVADLVRSLPVPTAESRLVLPEVLEPAYPSRPRSLQIATTKEQAHFTIAFPGLVVSDRRLSVLDVLVTVLGGQSGRLFSALREREGLVYHVSASAAEGPTAGHVVVRGATSHAKLGRALAASWRELETVVRDLVPADELRRAKAWLAGQHAVELQRRSRVASHLAFERAFGRRSGRYRRYPAEIERVTAQQVRRLARELLDRSRSVEVRTER